MDQTDEKPSEISTENLQVKNEENILNIVGSAKRKMRSLGTLTSQNPSLRRVYASIGLDRLFRHSKNDHHSEKINTIDGEDCEVILQFQARPNASKSTEPILKEIKDVVNETNSFTNTKESIDIGMEPLVYEMDVDGKIEKENEAMAEPVDEPVDKSVDKITLFEDIIKEEIVNEKKNENSIENNNQNMLNEITKIEEDDDEIETCSDSDGYESSFLSNDPNGPNVGEIVLAAFSSPYWPAIICCDDEDQSEQGNFI